MMPGPLAWAGLLLTGTAAGLDLATGPQVLLNRPVVVGTLAGLILGDAWAGMLVGSALELFALEVLPVGASRYPDFGPGTVGAALVLWSGGVQDLWRAVLVGLAAAVAGGWSLMMLRRRNADAAAQATAALQALEPGVYGRLQRAGVGRDLLRSAVLTVVGVGLAQLSDLLPPVAADRAGWLNAAALGAGAAAAINGAVRNAGRGRRLGALGAGLAAGTLWAVLR
jgi:PTS system mannose-specific IIC component